VRLPNENERVSEDLKGQLQTSLGTTYMIERELGGGGMSRTFVALETSLNRRVVVKVLTPDLAAGVALIIGGVGLFGVFTGFLARVFLTPVTPETGAIADRSSRANVDVKEG